MASSYEILKIAPKIRTFSSFKRNFAVGKIIYNKKVTSGPSTIKDVPGLSSAVLKVPQEPVGPGAAKNAAYKNPEYYCYDKGSYFEAEVEMLKYRLPQPSVKQYYKPSS